MRRAFFGILFATLALPAVLLSQTPSSRFNVSPDIFTMVEPVDPTEGEGGSSAGQVEPAAYGYRAFTKLTLFSAGGTLGTGLGIATNIPHHLDLRLAGHYTDFDFKFYQSDFYIVLNAGMANAEGAVDYYPWKALRISPGYLLYNTDRLRADLAAEPGATFTFNHVTYLSDNADPVYGIGRLVLDGKGFTATTGWGHIVARDDKNFTFPFEIGAAFLKKPLVLMHMQGDVCLAQGYACAPVSEFPGFEQNLAAQLVKWNNTAAPFHIYPLISGGIAYTFRFRK